MPWFRAYPRSVQIAILALTVIGHVVLVAGWVFASSAEANWWLDTMAIANLAALVIGSNNLLVVVGVVGWWVFGWAELLVGINILSGFGLPLLFIFGASFIGVMEWRDNRKKKEPLPWQAARDSQAANTSRKVREL